MQARPSSAGSRTTCAPPDPCSVAYMHHPRFSSGIHGPDRTIAALWTTLARGGVDVVLAGHDHHYERFEPFDGIRSFVVGTGGRSLYPVAARLAQPRSAVRAHHTTAYSALTLAPESYDWRLMPVAGATFRDHGSARCGRR